jgi:hypothetical protein
VSIAILAISTDSNILLGDTSNVKYLSQASAHRKLYEQYGKEEDRIAWIGLSGQATKSEVMEMAYKLGRQKADKILEERYGPDWRSIQGKHASKALQEKLQTDENFRKEFLFKSGKSLRLAVEAAKSTEARQKRKETFEKIAFQKGSKNSNYGKMWTTNLELKQYRMHPKTEPLPEGWIVGRKSFVDKVIPPKEPKIRVSRVSPRKGIKLSEETKEKMRLAKSGKNNPMFGKKRVMSEESRKKISETLKKRRIGSAVKIRT